MSSQKLSNIAQHFRVKLGQKAFSDVLHIARQAAGLYANLKILLQGAVDPDIYEGEDNTQSVRNLVAQLTRLSRRLVTDSKTYGVSAKTAAQYKSQLQGLVNRIKGLIVVSRYLPLLQPISLALETFNPTAISRQTPKMIWHPIGPDEPEDPEPDLPLPPGLSGRRCPPGTPQRICDLGYWPIGYGPQQHAIERKIRG